MGAAFTEICPVSFIYILYRAKRSSIYVKRACLERSSREKEVKRKGGEGERLGVRENP